MKFTILIALLALAVAVQSQVIPPLGLGLGIPPFGLGLGIPPFGLGLGFPPFGLGLGFLGNPFLARRLLFGPRIFGRDVDGECFFAKEQNIEKNYFIKNNSFFCYKALPRRLSLSQSLPATSPARTVF